MICTTCGTEIKSTFATVTWCSTCGTLFDAQCNTYTPLIVGRARELLTTPTSKLTQEVLRECVTSPNKTLAILKEYALPYSDEQLKKLASATSGLGEIDPQTAQRELRRRALEKDIEEKDTRKRKIRDAHYQATAHDH